MQEPEVTLGQDEPTTFSDIVIVPNDSNPYIETIATNETNPYIDTSTGPLHENAEPGTFIKRLF